MKRSRALLYSFAVSIWFEGILGHRSSQADAQDFNNLSSSFKKNLRRENIGSSPFADGFLDESDNISSKSIIMVLCSNSCEEDDENNDCAAYETALSKCYNGSSMWPNDESWGAYDIVDEVNLAERYLRRSFYSTSDSTCQGDSTDHFNIPINECVGPFGPPRPYGIFHVSQDSTPISQKV